MPEAAVGFAFEQLEPSAPAPGDTQARLLADAAEQAEQLRETARAEGYAEGRAAGHERGIGEVSAAAAALRQACESLHALHDELVEPLERDAVELAVALAEKILAGALQARPELVQASVQGAIRRLGERRRITVLVNPADLELLDAAVGEEQRRLIGAERLELQGEERVARGGAVVRTEEGEVDASIQVQLERAREVLAAELANPTDA